MVKAMLAGQGIQDQRLIEHVTAAHAGDIRLQATRSIIPVDSAESWTLIRQRSIVRAKRDSMRRMRDRIEAERAAGSVYVHDWDRDRFPAVMVVSNG